MLLLPRIEEFGRERGGVEACSSQDRCKERPNPLKSCFHLCSSVGTELTDLEMVQQRKLLKSTAAQQSGMVAPHGEVPSHLSPHRPFEGTARKRDAATKPLQSLSATRSTQRFNGVDGISLSQAGSWLDSRAFSEADHRPLPASARGPSAPRPTDLVTLSPRGMAKAPSRRADLSEGERFVMRRCKGSLLRRYGTLANAFKKIDMNHSNGLGMTEFVEATQGMFRRAEAEILYRLLDKNCDATVTLDELHSQLDDI